MSDDRDGSNPTRDVVKGLGLLFRAGRHAAGKLKKEFDRSNLAQTLDDAGKEVARAANNVVGRITGEIPRPPSDAPPAEKKPGTGVRIEVDDEKKKP